MSCCIRHQLELIQQDTTSSKLYNTNQQISNPTEEFDHYLKNTFKRLDINYYALRESGKLFENFESFHDH
jgi:hypothetical protein